MSRPSARSGLRSFLGRTRPAPASRMSVDDLAVPSGTAGDPVTADARADGGRPSHDVLARRLVRAGLVDRAWCEAVAGRTFGDDVDAAEHVLADGAGVWSTHPLVSTDALTDGVRSALDDGDPRALLRYLRRPHGPSRVGPLVDPAGLPGTSEERAASPGGGLGLYLAAADDRTPLPGHPDVPLGEARAAMIAAAARIRHQESLLGPRTTAEWDGEAEEAWRQRWSQAPLPDTGELPLVSIVMPVRDRASIVERALASVAAQTLHRWELVVVDDGSSDDTVAVVERWGEGDDRVRVVARGHAGVCAARNTGLQEARGRYVAFLDSDNAWRPDFLALALAAMHGEGHRAAYAGMLLCDDDAPDRPRYRAFRGGLEHLLVLNHVDLNVLVVERTLLEQVGGFDESLRRWVDHDLVLRVAAVTEPVLLPFIGLEYDDTRGAERPADRITTRESEAWQYVVLGQHWVDWDAVQRGVADRVPGRLSVVIPTWNDVAMTTRAVERVLRNTPDTDLEVVVLDNGSAPALSLRLAAVAVVHEAVRVVRLPRNLNFAVGCNVGFARSTGSTVVFLNNDTEVRPGWKEPLLAALEQDDVLGAQPLLLYPDDQVQTSGTAFPVEGFLPTHFLAGHPREDAERVTDRRFHVVTAAALAMRADDVARLRGFDPIFVNGMEDVDLCLRAADLRPGHFVVVPESRVTHHEGMTAGRGRHIALNRVEFHRRWAGRLPASESWRWSALGFEIVHVTGDTASVPSPRIFLRRTPRTEGSRPVLRWGLRSPAPGGELGERWGDTHFLSSLAAGLRAEGQEVVTFRRGAHADLATAYDDVVLGVRGLEVIPPSPGKVNVLWIISHPDDVADEELLAFDLVYAASHRWAARLAERTGRPVRPLLQATDARRRATLSGLVGDGSRPVFVGGAPSTRVRPIVDDALTAGVPIEVHGPHWEGKIPESARGRPYVPNESLLQTYRTSGLVLADHWADMADAGFLANRLFDAVAAGARVVTDPVAGLELFEGAVQAYHSIDELAELCSPTGRDRFPDDEEMARIAGRVAAEHSFDARASTLVADVLAVHEARA